jgi:predicted RND superfamily exporter protein
MEELEMEDTATAAAAAAVEGEEEGGAGAEPVERIPAVDDPGEGMPSGCGMFHTYLVAMRWWGSVVSTPTVMFATLALFAGLVAAGAVATTRVEAGAAPQDYYPRSSYYYRYLEACRSDFGGEPEATSIVFQESPSPAALAGLKERIVSSGAYHFISDPLSAFAAHASTGRNTTRLAAPALLEQVFNWTQYQGRVPYQQRDLAREFLSCSHVERAESNKTLGYSYVSGCTAPRAARLTMWRMPLSLTSEMIDVMDSTQEWIDQVGLTESFAWANPFLEYSQIKELRKEVFRSIAVSLAAVFLVCLVVTRSVAISGLLVLLVLFMYMELFLLMWVLDMRINAVTVTCTILAAGFAIDYCLHIATATVGAQAHGAATWRERVSHALENMGAAVLNGGVTTLLASCGLALGSSGIMQVTPL